MTSKLVVLKPRSADAAGPPRVLADASLSLSFALPAGFTRPAGAVVRARGSGASNPSATSTAPPRPAGHSNAMARDAWSDDDSADLESWETRDFSVDVQAPLQNTAYVAEDEDEDDDESHVDTTTFAALEVGGWEAEQDALALPDDFPLLLVNLTRLQREHFPPAPHGEQTPALSGDEMRQLFELVKQTLHQHFTHMAEVLFEQKSAFHCTYGTSRAMLANLHAAYPDDVFGLVDYPTEIQGIALSEFLHVLSRPSRWKSVDYLKDCLRRCSRDIKWKLDVALELDVLAENEYEAFTAEQDRQSAEIDDLTRLRDSFKDKLTQLAASKGTSASRSTHGSQEYLLLRKLEDIETRLVALLDVFLQPPELQEHECDGMFAGGVTTGMNVLDMVVAMVFSRLPRDFRQQLTSEEHFEMLFDHHIHVRRLWKRDFGRLPVRTNAAAYATAHSDNDSADGRVEADGDVEADTFENQRHRGDGAYDDDDSDEHKSGDNDDDDEDDDLQRHAALSSDSWEAVDADDIRDDSIRIEWSGDDGDQDASRSDGYGADEDSDGSEDALATELSSRSSQQMATGESTTLGRRQRVRKATASGSAVVATVAVGAQEEPTPEKANKTKKKSKVTSTQKKKKKRTSRPTSAAKDDDVPFQPFACTGALSLLRLAKENELF